jgi:hypothetical protein
VFLIYLANENYLLKTNNLFVAEICPSTECWEWHDDDSTCRLKSDQLGDCSSLNCNFDSMDISFKPELFGLTNADLTAIFGLSSLDDGVEQAMPEWDADTNRWKLSCPIGGCGMSYETSIDGERFVCAINFFFKRVPFLN